MGERQELLNELARIKCSYQLRSIMEIMGNPVLKPLQHQVIPESAMRSKQRNIPPETQEKGKVQ